ncbi:MAG: 3-keto-disaccharide hydrolase [Pirellulaceae bacterium]
MRQLCWILTVLLSLALPQLRADAEGPAKGISLFDGKTLDGWDGDPRFWSVKEGVICGQTTPENPTEHNTFLIWRKGVVDDFQLDLDFRLVGGNSGIQYRSQEADKWVIGGYQADFDASGTYSGILYEERGRGILAERGKQVVVNEQGKVEVVGDTTENETILRVLKKNDWNHYTIIAKGNHLIHKINGLVTVEVTDNQADKRSLSGLLAFQVHQGDPMLVQFRNIQLQPLGDSPQTTAAETVELFNGRDLTGWSAQPKDNPATAETWSVEDGLLKCTGKPVGYLRTDRDDFENYVLTLEWRWPGSGGNNGVLVHASTPGALGVWPKSIEVQLGAGDAGDFWIIGTDLDVPDEAHRKQDRRHINLTDGSEKPLGQWNQIEITCRAAEVIVKVNGEVVNHATNCSVTQGAICLQSEGAPIEFRNIKLTPAK